MTDTGFKKLFDVYDQQFKQSSALIFEKAGARFRLPESQKIVDEAISAIGGVCTDGDVLAAAIEGGKYATTEQALQAVDTLNAIYQADLNRLNSVFVLVEANDLKTISTKAATLDIARLNGNAAELKIVDRTLCDNLSGLGKKMSVTLTEMADGISGGNGDESELEALSRQLALQKPAVPQEVVDQNNILSDAGYQDGNY